MKTITLHFIVNGKGFTKMIQACLLEHNLTRANKLLDALIPIPKYAERQAIFTGSGQFVGNTLCDKIDCDQCRPLRKQGDFAFVKKPDKRYKKEILEHKRYVKQYLIVVDGDTTIEKTVVADLVIKKYILDQTKKLRYKDRDPERLSSQKISKRYLEALDDWEMAQDHLYRTFNIVRGEKYPIGKAEWKASIEVQSIMDVIEAQSLYIPEIKELINHYKETGSYTVRATEKYFDMVESKRDMIEESVTGTDRVQNYMKQLDKQLKKPTKKAKNTKKIKLGKFNIPEQTLNEYVDFVKSYSLKMMVEQQKMGKLDPLREMDRLNKRIELHKAIFEVLNLPYHADIDTRKNKLTKKEKESMDLQKELGNYTDKAIEK